MKLRELAEWLSGETSGDPELEVLRPAKLEEAKPGDVSFLANPKYERHLATTGATVVLVSRTQPLPAADGRSGPAYLRVDDPRMAFANCMERFNPLPDSFPKGIHPSAHIAPTARLGEGVSVGAGVVIGDRVVIGARTRILPGAVISADVSLGEDCTVHPNVTIYPRSRLGSRVVLHAGAVIGADGFGFTLRPDATWRKVPQMGIVVIEDDVEIGANSAVDRATLGETRVGRGAKLDNLVMIAHNCVIGENTAMAAQVGIAGSTRIGRNCLFGGQVGLIGHLEIADRTVFLAQAGVIRSVKEPGKTLSNYPAREHRESMKREAAAARVPQLLEEMRVLRAEVSELKRILAKQRGEPVP